MNLSPKKNPNGCLWLLVMSMTLTVIFGVITVSLEIPILITLLLSVACAIFITIKLVGKPALISLLKILLILGFIVGIIGAGIAFLIKQTDIEYNDTRFTSDENVEMQMYLDGRDSIQVYATARHWRDNYGNDYGTTLMVRNRDFLRLRNHLTNYRPNSSPNFWGELYDYIERTDSPSLDLIIQGFSAIQKEKELNAMEFAEMVVSCIQDIPYSFVFPDECLPAEQYEDAIRIILEQCPECCIGNISYGIQNPVSFMQNLKGDCDTRTVIIYSILKHFGYDVAILNSDFYRHSILGVNLPATGYNKIHNGKKYILWETTAKYFAAGDLPATYNDITQWNVVLTSK